MLKKITWIALLLMVITSVTAFAADSAEGTVIKASPKKKSLKSLMDSDKATEKLSRGLANMATSPGEFIYQIPASQKQSPDYLTAFFVNTVRGTGYMVARFFTGLYDVVTFPFPGKTQYQPLMEPETIVEPVGEVVSN